MPKLNEVTKVTTMGTNDYVMLNTSDGNTVQIKKTDLADAMRSATTDKNGLMSNTFYSVFRFLFIPITRDQFDNKPITSSSERFIFFRNVSVLGSSTPGSNWFFGFAIRASGSDTEKQYVFNYIGNVYFRAYDGEKWGEMKKISF